MSAFTDAVEKGSEGLEALSPGACPGCPDCMPTDNVDDPGDDWHDLANEGGFSINPCHLCGSTLAGSRFPAHAFVGDDMIHLRICTDCLVFLANGDEPEVWR